VPRHGRTVATRSRRNQLLTFHRRIRPENPLPGDSDQCCPADDTAKTESSGGGSMAGLASASRVRPSRSIEESGAARACPRPRPQTLPPASRERATSQTPSPTAGVRVARTSMSNNSIAVASKWLSDGTQFASSGGKESATRGLPCGLQRPCCSFREASDTDKTRLPVSPASFTRDGGWSPGGKSWMY
jgi:hypothetical protein